jgi:hypothetical protein
VKIRKDDEYYEDLNRIAEAIGYERFQDSGWHDDNYKAWRGDLFDALVSRLDDSEADMERIVYDLEHDCESICRRWKSHHEMQIAAMQFGARWILDNEFASAAA